MITMKAALLTIMLAVAAIAATASDTVYHAPTGYVAYVNIGTRMYFTDGGRAGEYPKFPYGCSIYQPCIFNASQLVYTLSDGTTASLTNFAGTRTYIPGGAYLTWHVGGTASGLDSTGTPVAVTVSWTYTLHSRSGRGGGNFYKYTSGSMEVVK
jgi:hypothetical protein